MSLQYKNIVYCADVAGTGMWRKIWPINMLNCYAQQTNILTSYSQIPIIDQNYYKGMNSITIQRWVSDLHKNIFEKFLKPISDINSTFLIYEEDDLMFDGTLLNKEKTEFIEKKYGKLNEIGIPLYNRGRKAFEGEHVQNNIKYMLLNSDLVTVTTNYIKEIYHDLYDVPLENIVAVPNLLPKYLFGDRYDLPKKLELFKANKQKPRVGIVSSLSHYNVDNVRMDKYGNAVRLEKRQDGTEVWINEHNTTIKYEDTIKITDDFDEIADVVRSTVDLVQWVMFGYCPPQIEDLAKAGKVEVHRTTSIMNYASMLENLKLQMIVAPIKKTPFNFCKSFIKTMEAASIGVPLFATNCLPYSSAMDRSMLFDTGSELKEKILRLKDGSMKIYQDIIERQWKWLNSPCHEGDFDLRNFWLEDNMNIHIDMNKLHQKTVNVSMKVFSQSYEQRKAAEKANTIYKNENILITK